MIDWIKISDGLPPIGDRVLAVGHPALISDGGRWVKVIAYLGNETWASFDEEYPTSVPPTHWIPLPKLPK